MNEKERARLQENLEMLRKLFGWSSQQLANRLGINKQTVLNLESGVTDMSQIQYIAIRAIFEAEVELREGEEQENIKTIMAIVFNKDLAIPDEKKTEALSIAKDLSELNTKKKQRQEVTQKLAVALGAAGIVTLMGAVICSSKNENALKDRLVDFLSDR